MSDNYPNGVSTFDIPGFRKEDEDIDTLYEKAKREFERAPTWEEMGAIIEIYHLEGFSMAEDEIIRIADEL